MKYLSLIVKNLFRNRRRTVLTVFSIAVSIFIFSTLASVPMAVDQVLSNVASSRRLVVHNRAGLAYGTTSRVSTKDLDTAARRSGRRAVLVWRHLSRGD